MRARAIYAALSLTAFAALAFAVHDAPPSALDLSLSHVLQRHAWLEAPMRLVSVPGDAFTPHLLATLTALLFFARRMRREALFLAFTTAMCGLLNGGLKRLVARPRPSAEEVTKLDLVSGFSFPSGHTAFYVCFFGALAVIATEKLEGSRRALALGLCILPIALVPFSRVYLGAHYASDTLGSLLWATAFLTLAARAYAGPRAV